MKLGSLFFVSSPAQCEMLHPIAGELPGWNITMINTDIGNRVRIETFLGSYRCSHETLERITTKAVQQVLDKYEPKVVVFGHDIRPIDRLLIYQANAKRIPTLLVQDGILWNRDVRPDGGRTGSNYRYWVQVPQKVFTFLKVTDYSLRQKLDCLAIELRYNPRGKVGMYGHGECSKMAVWGKSVETMFVSEGISPDRIEVTGNPKFDGINRFGDEDGKRRVCTRLGISPDNHIVLLLTQHFVEAGLWTVEQRREFVVSIANAVGALPGVKLIIKVHPSFEDESTYNEIIKDLQSGPLVVRRDSLPELVNCCSLAITVSSTAALEAMAMKRPVLIVNLFQDKGCSFYQGSGAQFATRAADITPAIERVLYDNYSREEMLGSMEKFVYAQAYLQDGQAARRIAELIRSMATAR